MQFFTHLPEFRSRQLEAAFDEFKMFNRDRRIPYIKQRLCFPHTEVFGFGQLCLYCDPIVHIKEAAARAGFYNPEISRAAFAILLTPFIPGYPKYMYSPPTP
jgi:hypothetical protein